jgi:hypothetical protein
MVMPTLICACALPIPKTVTASATIQPLLRNMTFSLWFVLR